MLITFIMIILSSQIGWNMTIYDDIDTYIEVKSYLVNGLWCVSINNERVCHFMYIFLPALKQKWECRFIFYRS